MSEVVSPTKNKRPRFTINDDLEILRQLFAENPFEVPLKWKTITKGVVASTGKEFSRRAIRDRVEHLLMSFLKEDTAKLRKSGTEKEYKEKEILFQELVDLMRNFNSKSLETEGLQVREAAPLVNCLGKDDLESEQENISSIEEDKEITQANEAKPANLEYISILGMPMVCQSVSSTVPSPQITRNNQSNEKIINTTIQHRGDKEYQLMEEQLEIEKKRLELEKERILLEQRKITLEEEKFQLEKRERLMRLEIEREERQAHIKNMEHQQQLMVLLINQQNSNKKH